MTRAIVVADGQKARVVGAWVSARGWSHVTRAGWLCEEEALPTGGGGAHLGIQWCLEVHRSEGLPMCCGSCIGHRLLATHAGGAASQAEVGSSCVIY